MARERVVLIDGSSLIFRAFFAIPQGFSTRAGLPTNATYGFALMFRKILQGRTPKYGAVVFDAPGATFRDEMYPDYKADRPRMPGELRQQIPYIHQLVEAHDFPMFSVPGYEADDVIGTLCRMAREVGHEVRIFTGDKDFAQLIDDETRLVVANRTTNMDDVTYDAETARKKWGVGPAQFIDLLALMGDKIDNIPGVPGVGAKTAKTLLETYGDLEGILANTHELKGKLREKMETFAEQARLSRKLATIDQHVPLERTLDELTLPAVDVKKVDGLYQTLEFYSLLSEQPRAEAAHEDLEGDFGVCGSLDEVGALLEAARGAESVAVQALWEQPSFVTGELAGIALSVGPDHARYVPLFGAEGSLGEPALRAVGAWLADPAEAKVVHGLRDLTTLLDRYGVAIRGVAGDTQLASFLVDPAREQLIPHRLDQVVREYLHTSVSPLKTLIGSGKAEKRLAELPTEATGRYAGYLASTLHALWPKVRERLEAEGRAALLHEHEIPMAYVLGRMQAVGIRVDPDILSGLQAEFATRKAEIEARIYEMAGHTFNLRSTKQLATVLFEELELPVIKRTKTGYSTAQDVLERLAPKHEIAGLIVRQRALEKLINTYTSVLRDAINPATGRVHATFQQTSGMSGRLITTDPDLQRTPVRTEDGARIRAAFVPRAGWVLISADWSQIELRLLAHFTEDPVLVEAFSTGADVHRRTAARIFDVPEAEVTYAQRQAGKTVNFASIYGQGATALGQQIGVKRKEAKAFLDRYFERYAGVRRWLDDTIRDAHIDGFVETLLGRRRYIEQLSSRNPTERAYGERIAANTPIQGSAADLCKLAMLHIDRDLTERGMEARMLVQIHDELLFECPPEELDAACGVIRERMEGVWPELKVPLVVDIGHGESWLAAK
jgi:DNA polymerase-1